MIIIENISKSFISKNGNITKVLDNLSMKVDSSQVVALMGPSGAGKSTLLYLMGFLDTVDSGKIYFHIDENNIDLSTYNDNNISKFRNKNIGFIFQFYHLLPELTALENIMTPAIIAGDNFKNAREKALILLNKVGLSNRADNKPNELSGGEQQRIAIARALINQPSIIFADEPTGNLDSANTQIIIELLNSLRNEYNLTMIIATHSQEIAKMADKICYLKDGKIHKTETN